MSTDSNPGGMLAAMVVIFGFGAGKEEDLGEVVACNCPNCHNEVLLHHVRSKKSVRLYFVPVVPYGTNDYLVCPVCSRGVQINQAQLSAVRSMSSATASLRAGRLAQAQYLAQAERFLRQVGVNPAGQQHLTPAGSGVPPRVPPAPSAPTAQPPAPAARPPAPAMPATPPPAAAGVESPWISQLRNLAQLHDQGVLSDADYQAAKRRVLERE